MALAGTAITVPGDVQSSVQWLKDNQIIAGETGNSLTVAEGGDYLIFVSNITHMCVIMILSERIEVLALPLINAGQDLEICAGDTVN